MIDYHRPRFGARVRVGFGPDENPAGGSTPAATPAQGSHGGQAPANPETAEILSELKALRGEVAPLRDTVKRLENESNAARRVRTRGDGDAGGDAGGVDPKPAGPINASKIPDLETREAVTQLVRENDARNKRDRDQEAAAAKSKAHDHLKKVIADQKATRPGLLFESLESKTKVGADGRFIYDDGSTILPIEDVVRQRIAADDAFKPAPGGNGTSTPQGSAPPLATPPGSVSVDPNAKPEVKLAAAFKAGADAVVSRK